MARCRCSESKLATGDFENHLLLSSQENKGRCSGLFVLHKLKQRRSKYMYVRQHRCSERIFLCFPHGLQAFFSPPASSSQPSTLQLKSKMQTSSDVAEYTIRIPQRAMMSSMQKLWESVIQGQQNKAANRDSKYITAHFSPPELNWQR